MTTKGYQGNLNNGEIAKYLEGCINQGLGAGSDESSYTNSFRVEMNLERGFFDVIATFPSTFVLTDLYEKVYGIALGALYPVAVLLPRGFTLVKTNSSNLATARGLRFYFKLGTFNRYFYRSFEDVKLVSNGGQIMCPIEQNIAFKPENMPLIALSGRSGTGKSTLFTTLVEEIRKYIFESYIMWDWKSDWMSSNNSEINQLWKDKNIIIIDPKLDTQMYFYAQRHQNQITYLSPNVARNPAGFLNEVADLQQQMLAIIRYRQEAKIKNPRLHFAPILLAIDEVQYATSSQSSQQVKLFQSLTDRLALTCRSANGVLLFSSQEYAATGTSTVMSAAARDGASLVCILDKNPDTRATRFLLPDYKPGSVVITPDEYDYGLGLIEIDNQVYPLRSPLIQSSL